MGAAAGQRVICDLGRASDPEPRQPSSTSGREGSHHLGCPFPDVTSSDSSALTAGAVSCPAYTPSLVRVLGHAHAAAFLWMIYLGVAPTAIGFATWAYALARTTAGRMGATTYLVPPLAVALGWVVLGEVRRRSRSPAARYAWWA